VPRLRERAAYPARRKAEDVEAAREWIIEGTIGVVSFDDATQWLGLDPERTRRAILAGVVRRA
jgi:hypothetical protein